MSERQPDDVRPWGHYFILKVTPKHQTKHLVVNPGHRFSLQYHEHRDEHWIIVAGRGLLTLNNEEREVGVGEYVCVPRGTRHRMKCISQEPLEFIEVWTGDYFGEDDNVRLQDDYTRSLGNQMLDRKTKNR